MYGERQADILDAVGSNGTMWTGNGEKRRDTQGQKRRDIQGGWYEKGGKKCPSGGSDLIAEVLYGSCVCEPLPKLISK